MAFLANMLRGLLFKHQHLNASPYGFAGVYRQCRCVITVCTRKSPACHKVCNFNKIYCPFFRFNINKDNVHKSIISWSRSVHEKRCIGVSIKLNIYRKCWKISNINEDLTILCRNDMSKCCSSGRLLLLYQFQQLSIQHPVRMECRCRMPTEV